jgi:hypothetical protein
MPGKVHRTFPSNNEHILTRNNLVAIPAKTFSEKPLDSVPDNRTPHFRTNGYAEPASPRSFGLVIIKKWGIDLFPQRDRLRNSGRFSDGLASESSPPPDTILLSYVRARFGGT